MEVIGVKKFFILIWVFATLIFYPGISLAKDFWVYEYPNGKSLYIVYESVMYGERTSIYAKFRIKRVNESGKLIKTENWEIGLDEGNWWYGIVGESRGIRVYDYEDSTEVFRWLKEHSHEAHRTTPPWLVLGD